MAALVPELSVSDVRVSLRFWCGILGFSVLYDRPDEGFAYLTLGEAEVMLDEIGKGRSFDALQPARDRPFGRGINLQIRVASVTPVLQGLAAAAWPLFLPMEDRWYRRGNRVLGNRQFVVADPDGYMLRLFEPVGQRSAAPLVSARA